MRQISASQGEAVELLESWSMPVFLKVPYPIAQADEKVKYDVFKN